MNFSSNAQNKLRRKRLVPFWRMYGNVPCVRRQRGGPAVQCYAMTDNPNLADKDLIEAHEASDVSAINGIVSLANILRKRGLLSDAEASAMYESMSLPLGLPKYAENPAVQDLQSNLDRLFAVVVAPK